MSPQKQKPSISVSGRNNRTDTSREKGQQSLQAQEVFITAPKTAQNIRTDEEGPKVDVRQINGQDEDIQPPDGGGTPITSVRNYSRGRQSRVSRKRRPQDNLKKLYKEFHVANRQYQKTRQLAIDMSPTNHIRTGTQTGTQSRKTLGAGSRDPIVRKKLHMRDQYIELVNLRVIQVKFEEQKPLVLNELHRQANSGLGIESIQPPISVAKKSMKSESGHFSQDLALKRSVKLTKLGRGGGSAEKSDINTPNSNGSKEMKKRLTSTVNHSLKSSSEKLAGREREWNEQVERYFQIRNRHLGLIQKQQRRRSVYIAQVARGLGKLQAEEAAKRARAPARLDQDAAGTKLTRRTRSTGDGGAEAVGNETLVTGEEDTPSSQSECQSHAQTISSFESDDSYYEEDDEFNFAPITQAEVRDHTVKIATGKLTAKQIQKEARKLQQIFASADTVNQRPLNERNIHNTHKFFKNLPSLQPHMHKLNRHQIKLCLEKLRIKIYEQGETLFKQFDQTTHAFIILSGVVKMYDETIPQNIENRRGQIDLVIAGEGIIPDDEPVRATGSPKPASNPNLPIQQINEQSSQTPEEEQMSYQDLEIESLKSDQIENTTLDPVPGIIRRRFPQRVKTYQAGEIIGSLGPASEQRQEYTAMCKTDCLLVSIEQNVMGMLLQHKDRMLRESVCKFFLQNLPNFSRFYTPLKVLETINEITTRITLSKGDLVLRENSTYADPAYFYVIIEGQVRLSKVMSYLDEQDKLVQKNHSVLDITVGDFIGEDALLFERDQQYSATISSLKCSLFKVKAQSFSAAFPRLTPSLGRLAEARFQFMNERMHQNRLQSELGCLRVKNSIPQSLQTSLALYNAKKFKDPSKPSISRLMSNIFFREDSMQKKTYDELKELTIEKLKHEDSIAPAGLQKPLQSVATSQSPRHNSISPRARQGPQLSKFETLMSSHLHSKSQITAPQAALFDGRADSSIFKHFANQGSFLSSVQASATFANGSIRDKKVGPAIQVLEIPKVEVYDHLAVNFNASQIERTPEVARNTQGTQANLLETTTEGAVSQRTVKDPQNIRKATLTKINIGVLEVPEKESKEKHLSQVPRSPSAARADGEKLTSRSKKSSKRDIKILKQSHPSANNVLAGLQRPALGLQGAYVGADSHRQLPRSPRRARDEVNLSRIDETTNAKNAKNLSETSVSNLNPTYVRQPTSVGPYQHDENEVIDIRVVKRDLELNSGAQLELIATYEDPREDNPSDGLVNQSPLKKSFLGLKDSPDPKDAGGQKAARIGSTALERLKGPVQLKKRSDKEAKILMSDLVKRLKITETRKEYTKLYRKRTEGHSWLKKRLLAKGKPAGGETDSKTLLDSELVDQIRDLVREGFAMPSSELVERLDEAGDLQDLIKCFRKELTDKNDILRKRQQQLRIEGQDDVDLLGPLSESQVFLYQDQPQTDAFVSQSNHGDSARRSSVPEQHLNPIARSPVIKHTQNQDSMPLLPVLHVPVNKVKRKKGESPRHMQPFSIFSTKAGEKLKRFKTSVGNSVLKLPEQRTSQLNLAGKITVMTVPLSKQIQSQKTVDSPTQRFIHGKTLLQKADIQQRRRKKFNDVIRERYHSTLDFVSETQKMTHHKRFCSFDRHKQRLFATKHRQNSSAPWIEQFMSGQETADPNPYQSGLPSIQRSFTTLAAGTHPAVHMKQKSELPQQSSQIVNKRRLSQPNNLGVLRKEASTLSMASMSLHKSIIGSSSHNNLAARVQGEQAVANQDLKTLTLNSWNEPKGGQAYQQQPEPEVKSLRLFGANNQVSGRAIGLDNSPVTLAPHAPSGDETKRNGKLMNAPAARNRGGVMLENLSETKMFQNSDAHRSRDHAGSQRYQQGFD